MKSFAFCLAALLLVGAAFAQSRPNREVVLDFEAWERGKPPMGFTMQVTGGGGPATWVLKQDASSRSGSTVLAQTGTDKTDYRFPLCIFNKFSVKDVAVSVRFKPVSGQADQAGGLVTRFKDKDNYYVARANALENNVRLYKVEAGKRKQFAGVNTQVSSGQWHTLKMENMGAHFKVYFDGKLLFEADDSTFGEPGRVGVWTKADSVTCFDDLILQSFDRQ